MNWLNHIGSLGSCNLLKSLQILINTSSDVDTFCIILCSRYTCPQFFVSAHEQNFIVCCELFSNNLSQFTSQNLAHFFPFIDEYPLYHLFIHIIYINITKALKVQEVACKLIHA